MQADRQQQRDPNRDRRRAADKYKFNNRGVRTEVDEEQTRQVANLDSGFGWTTVPKMHDQTVSDAEPGKTRRNQTDAESDVTNITGQQEPFQPGANIIYSTNSSLRFVSASLVFFTPAVGEAVAWLAEGTFMLVAPNAFSTMVANQFKKLGMKDWRWDMNGISYDSLEDEIVSEMCKGTSLPVTSRSSSSSISMSLTCCFSFLISQDNPVIFEGNSFSFVDMIGSSIRESGVKKADLVSFKISDKSSNFTFHEMSSAMDSSFAPEVVLFLVPSSIPYFEDMESLGVDIPGSASAVESAKASCLIPINKVLIQAIPTSLPPQPIGEATKASNLRRIPPEIFLDYRVILGFGSMGGLDLACPIIRLSSQLWDPSDMEDDVDISALTMEQYIALIPDDIKPGIMNPKISDDVEFEINANFMRELRRKLFTCIDDEDAYEHVRRVLKIVDLFHYSGVTHDAIMLRVFPITLKGRALRWKNRPLAGTITTWDLLKKEFFWRYCHPFITAKNEKISPIPSKKGMRHCIMLGKDTMIFFTNVRCMI
ncbi:hypothetical protein Tco_0792795 [Tanacetum coccineum]